MNKNRSSLAAYPYILWSALFIVIPLLIILYFSLTDASGHFSLENFSRLGKGHYWVIFLRSIRLALISTILCLILGYPVAYIISKLNPSKGALLIMLFIVPMWMNFLLRTYAWFPILGKTGIINSILGKFGLGPFPFLYNEGAVLLGMVYNFLPFMILPIYTILSKMDNDLINAARDLGADRKTVFLKVTLPLSMPGIMSGITMVFMPAVSTFVISNLLGGGKTMLIGNLIELQFSGARDWNFGSTLSIIMMIIIIITMAIISKFNDKTDKEGGAGLW